MALLSQSVSVPLSSPSSPYPLHALAHLLSILPNTWLTPPTFTPPHGPNLFSYPSSLTPAQVVATNANAAYVNLTRNLWAAMRRTGEANLLVQERAQDAACAYYLSLSLLLSRFRSLHGRGEPPGAGRLCRQTQRARATTDEPANLPF